jgi:hypothetical protein
MKNEALKKEAVLILWFNSHASDKDTTNCSGMCNNRNFSVFPIAYQNSRSWKRRE